MYSQIFKHPVSDLVGNHECWFSHVYDHICISTAKSIIIVTLCKLKIQLGATVCLMTEPRHKITNNVAFVPIND